jgi:hypothetical protein
MRDNINVNQENSTNRDRTTRKGNKWGIYISIVLIIVGLIWYGVNVGVIPLSIIQEQAGPIIVILLGILILIKSL